MHKKIPNLTLKSINKNIGSLWSNGVAIWMLVRFDRNHYNLISLGYGYKLGEFYSYQTEMDQKYFLEKWKDWKSNFSYIGHFNDLDIESYLCEHKIEL